MKINPAKAQAAQIANAKTKDVAPKNANVAGKSTANAADIAASSKVNVSDQAQAMQKAKEVASNNNVNESRVAELQKMIDSGNYNVSASAIADRMVDEHLLMGE